MNPTNTPQQPPVVVAAPVYAKADPTGKVLRKLYLKIFLRGRSARGLSKKGAPTSVARRLALSLFFYALFGCVAIGFIGKPVFPMSLYLHGTALAFLGLFVASSTGEVLFNKEEPDILLHRPIDSRELLWAKVSVMIMVALWLSMAYNMAGFVTGVFASDGGWRYPLVHAASSALEAVFCTSLVVVMFQLCLRWFGREKLDALLTTVQVVMAIVVVLAGQIIPRMLGPMMQFLTPLSSAWWIRILPVAWFAGFDDAMAGSGAAASWMMAGMGLVSTAALTWLAFGKLSAGYNEGLQMMSQSRTIAPKSRKGNSFIYKLVHVAPFSWWLRDSVERSSFMLTAAYLSRDRDVKLRVYPGIAPIMVMPIVFLLPGKMNAGMGDFGLAFGASYLGLVPYMALNILQYSDQWQACDIFRIAPLIGPVQIFHGARKAVLILLGLPMLCVFVVIVLALKQDPKYLVLLLPGIISAPVYSLVPMINGRTIPLSQPAESAKSANRGLHVLLVTFLGMGTAGLATWAWKAHFFSYFLAGQIVLAMSAYLILKATSKSSRWEPL